MNAMNKEVIMVMMMMMLRMMLMMMMVRVSLLKCVELLIGNLMIIVFTLNNL